MITDKNLSTPIALTIAGSDSGGGAGIQADLKAFSALGAYGCSVITALTAQNTQGVQGIFDVDPAFIRQQLDSIFSDIDVTAVKIGMLSQPKVIETVAERLEHYKVKRLVVDPVMVATSGDVLLQREAIQTLKEVLIPQASLITPNLPEAAVLLDQPKPESTQQMLDMIEPLLELGSKAVLLKGGHLAGSQVEGGKAVDFYHDGQSLHRLESVWTETNNTHGTGCTLSSAITALLAKGFSMTEAVQGGKEYIAAAIAKADDLNIGQGHGPVHHFYRNW
ncbi:hydroxymethylpyrimidine kinase [Endozoicomonas montiporae]|uniref:hydroxymethylpyrimidine kinase n=2 Tax=Endozoicomonas montiporae TaxID=1027273 RepID=A0A081N230_9GAMM|nr:bifunctional hydroxymethylpyrimidine kinase/phosphomethylpyrimidine kinase [Endozoicomonas montiporae]AMO58543.1 hydroxymethylpyrimidine/phosphomethylpyrimidine kinase [Endozoicomonas montiporae CL-33]KEQ12503.1 hydroxymethylpyrimidine kinase [Endozoicomonas montiporae]